MAGAGEIASAYLTIYPKLEGKSVVSEVERGLGSAGTSAGRTFSDNASAAMRTGMGAAGTAGSNALAEGFSAAKIAVANVISNIAMDAARQLQASFMDGVSQSDALQKFFSTMEFAGFDTSQIEGTMSAMRDYADQTVYDLDEVLNTTAKLAANGVSDYDQLVQAAGNLNAAAGGNAESFGYFANAITQVNGAGRLMSQDWNQIVNALPGASGAIQNELLQMGAWDESMGTFKDALAAGEVSADEFNQALVNLGMTDVAKEAATSTDTFEGAMGQFEAAVTNTMMEVYDALNEDGRITDAITAMGDAFETVAPYVSALADAFGDFVEFISPALPIIAGIAAGVAAASGIATVIGAISGAITFLTTVVGPALAMVGSVPGLVALVTSVLGGPITIIAAVAGAIIAFVATNEDARNTIVSVVTNVKNVVSNVFNSIRTTIANVANFIRTALPNAVNAMRSAVTNGINNVRNAFTSLKSRITGALAGAGTWLASAGRNIIQGLVNGISGATSWVTSTIKSVCSNAVGALKSFFGIHSPSTLMAEMGEYMMAGLANGIEDGSDKAVGAMTGASKDVAGALGLAGNRRPSFSSTPSSVAKGGGAVNLYIDGMRVNDDERIRADVIQLVTDLGRYSAAATAAR